MKKLIKLIRIARGSCSSVFMVVLRYFLFRFRGPKILATSRVIIRGLKNIQTAGTLQIGMSPVGFTHKYDVTLLNVMGKLIFSSGYFIGKGCRFDIGNNATVTIGNGSVNPCTTFVIMHGLRIGDGTVISWGCQFLDEDFHTVFYEGKKTKECPIEVGNHVWIGCNVTVLKGSKIPDGCVVAAGALVTSAFEKKNCLIAGNPAKIIRENVTWNPDKQRLGPGS